MMSRCVSSHTLHNLPRSRSRLPQRLRSRANRELPTNVAVVRANRHVWYLVAMVVGWWKDDTYDLRVRSVEVTKEERIVDAKRELSTHS